MTLVRDNLVEAVGLQIIRKNIMDICIFKEFSFKMVKMWLIFNKQKFEGEMTADIDTHICDFKTF